MKPKQTRRKFYNKWLYKVTLSIPGISMSRIWSHKDIMAGHFKGETSNNKSNAHKNRKTIHDVYNFLETLSDHSKRIEGNNIDIYINEKTEYDDIYKKFKPFVYHRFEPDPAALDHLNDNKTLIVKKLPKDRYQYRVYLKPHTVLDKQDKIKFIQWIKGQSPRISISPSVESWFLTTSWNWDRRYVLVEDEQTLLLLKLRNSNAVGSVYNYVIPINT